MEKVNLNQYNMHVPCEQCITNFVVGGSRALVPLSVCPCECVVSDRVSYFLDWLAVVYVRFVQRLIRNVFFCVSFHALVGSSSCSTGQQHTARARAGARRP